MKILSNMNELRSLCFGPCLVDSISPLSSLKHLTRLEIKSSPKLKEIPPLLNLQTFYIKNCSNFDYKMSISKQKIPNLKNLSIILSNLKDDDLNFISEQFQEQLESICLSYCVNLTENSILNIQNYKKLISFEARSLKIVNLEQSKMVWPITIKHFDMRNCFSVNSSFFSSLSKNM